MVTRRFEEIAVGEQFQVNGKVYVKCEPFKYHRSQWNARNVETDKAARFSPIAKVERVYRLPNIIVK